MEFSDQKNLSTEPISTNKMPTISRKIDYPIEPGLKSPWDLSNLSIFRYFICPEMACSFITANETPFTQHIKDHHDFFIPYEEIPVKLEIKCDVDYSEDENDYQDFWPKTENRENYEDGIDEKYNPTTKSAKKQNVSTDGSIRKPFECPKCPKTFSKKGDMERHIG